MITKFLYRINKRFGNLVTYFVRLMRREAQFLFIIFLPRGWTPILVHQIKVSPNQIKDSQHILIYYNDRVNQPPSDNENYSGIFKISIPSDFLKGECVKISKQDPRFC